MSRPSSDPIIVYGSVRAGTTMFRLMLGAHPDLVEVGENRYMVDGLTDRNAGEADLSYDTGRLTRDRVFRMRGLDCPGGLNGRALLDNLLLQLRKGRNYGPTVLTFHSDIATLDRLFPTARYIHIFRDPRDVAASTTRLGWSGNVYYGADFWLASEASWEAFRPRLDPARYAEIRYEDLVLQPRQHLEEVCDFLNVPFDEALLSYDRKSSYDAPDPRLTYQWRARLKPRDVAMVERKCGHLMQTRRYDRAYPDIAPLGPLGRGYMAVDNKVNKVASAVRFYGLRDYGLEKFYRLPGFKLQHDAVERSMQQTVNLSLK